MQTNVNNSVCPNLLSVCLAMSSLVFQPSSCHLLVSILISKTRLAGVIVESRRMLPTNRLLLVATVSCSAICSDRAITSSFVMTVVAPRDAQNAPEASTMENINHLVNSVSCLFSCTMGDYARGDLSAVGCTATHNDSNRWLASQKCIGGQHVITGSHLF